MRFSAKADYACVAMVELAIRFGAGQPVQIKAIAEAHGIPARFLVQILLQLKGVGLVASSRGTAGGYQLARAPEAITLAEIVGVVDPPPAFPATTPTAPESMVVQAIHEVWHDLSELERR